jgi:hypothetical protein
VGAVEGDDRAVVVEHRRAGRDRGGARPCRRARGLRRSVPDGPLAGGVWTRRGHTMELRRAHRVEVGFSTAGPSRRAQVEAALLIPSGPRRASSRSKGREGARPRRSRAGRSGMRDGRGGRGGRARHLLCLSRGQ